MPINEISEQKSNGYCNIDFVFTLDQTNASFIFAISTFSIMNLYLFLKCIPSDRISLPFEMRNILFFFAITHTVTELANGIVNVMLRIVK